MVRAISPLCLVLLAACGGTKTRSADAPLSPAAARVEIVSNAKPTCKKVGTAHGLGEDLDDKVADTQATNAAKEEAVKLGGDTIVIVTQTANARAGSGGTVQSIDKVVDVYSCPK